MALTKSSFKRPVVQSGDDVLTLKLPTGEHSQSVALIDETGEHTGTNSSPVVVHVENQATVSGRVESDRDLFGRTRIARPVSVFESIFEYSDLPMMWGDTPNASNGTITHSLSDSSLTLSVQPGQRAARRTHEDFKYQAGKAVSAYMTMNLGQSAGTIRRVGVFNDNNGVFIINDGSTTSLVFRSNSSGSVSDTVVPQSQWSEDKLDGTGISGQNIDFTKINIMVMEAQGMGAGEIRVGFLIDSNVTYFHEFHSANISVKRAVSDTAIPITYEIESTTGSGSLVQYDASVFIEGGLSILESSNVIYSASNGPTGVTVQAALSPVISIRPKTNFNGKTFSGNLIVDNVKILAMTNIMWQVVFNPLLVGATWTSVDPESATEFDVSATSITPGSGTVVLTGFEERKSGGTLDIPLTKIPLTVLSDLTTSDVLTVMITDIKGDGGNVFAAINFSENY